MKKSVTHSALRPATLTAESLTEGLRSLAERDADMARLLAELGAPPTWFREPGFPTLVHIILEQQISLASARAAFTRLLSVAAPLTPQNFLALDERQLKQVGFSRQKIIYARHLAQLISDGQLNLQALDALDDAGVKAELMKVKGIGAWTADIYLLMALRRPDAWPVGDLALAVAVQKVKRLAARPAPGELAAIGETWQPWRAVAARLLWHYYLMKG